MHVDDNERMTISNESIKVEAWKKLTRIIEEREEQVFKRREKDLNNLLVYAGLFSATAAAFLNSWYPFLQLDQQTAISAYARRISQQLGSLQINFPFLNSTIPALSNDREDIHAVEAFDHPYIETVAALWFLSLFWGLTAAVYCLVLMVWQSASREWRTKWDKDPHTVQVAASYKRMLSDRSASYYGALYLVHEAGDTMMPGSLLLIATVFFIIGLGLLYGDGLVVSEKFVRWFYGLSVGPLMLTIIPIYAICVIPIFALYGRCMVFTFSVLFFLIRLCFKAIRLFVRFIPLFSISSLHTDLQIDPEYWALIGLFTSNIDYAVLKDFTPCLMDLPPAGNSPEGLNSLSVSFILFASQANRSPGDVYRELFPKATEEATETIWESHTRLENTQSSTSSIQAVHRNRGRAGVETFLLCILQCLNTAPPRFCQAGANPSRLSQGIDNFVSPMKAYFDPLLQISPVHCTLSRANVLALSARMYRYIDGTAERAVSRLYFRELTIFIWRSQSFLRTLRQADEAGETGTERVETEAERQQRAQEKTQLKEEIHFACAELYRWFRSALPDNSASEPGDLTSLLRCATRSKDNGDSDAFLLLFEVLAHHLPRSVHPPRRQYIRSLMEYMIGHVEDARLRGGYRILFSQPLKSVMINQFDVPNLTPWANLLHVTWNNDVQRQLLTSRLLDALEEIGDEKSTIDALRDRMDVNVIREGQSSGGSRRKISQRSLVTL